MSLVKSSGIISRSISVLVTLFGISIFIFIVLRVIPGDTITGSLGIETGVLTPEQIDDLKRYYGIDKPLILQYFSWITSFLSGDLGFAYSTGVSVLKLTASTCHN